MTLRKGLLLSAAALAGAIALATPADARGGLGGGSMGSSIGGGAMGHMGGAASGSNAVVPAASLNGGGNVNAPVRPDVSVGRETRAGGSILTPESSSAMQSNATITGSHIPTRIGATGSNATVPAASPNGGGGANASPNTNLSGGTRTGSMLSPENGATGSAMTNANTGRNGVNASSNGTANSRFGLSGRSGNLSTAGFTNTNGRFAAHRTFGHTRAALRHALHHHHHMMHQTTTVHDNDADDRGGR